MNRCFERPFHKLATGGALALALLVAACGLRGSLDPPPAEAPPQAQLDGQPQQPQSSDEPESDQHKAARKRVFLDWLLD